MKLFEFLCTVENVENMHGSASRVCFFIFCALITLASASPLRGLIDRRSKSDEWVLRYYHDIRYSEKSSSSSGKNKSKTVSIPQTSHWGILRRKEVSILTIAHSEIRWRGAIFSTERFHGFGPRNGEFQPFSYRKQHNLTNSLCSCAVNPVDCSKIMRWYVFLFNERVVNCNSLFLAGGVALIASDYRESFAETGKMLP